MSVCVSGVGGGGGGLVSNFVSVRYPHNNLSDLLVLTLFITRTFYASTDSSLGLSKHCKIRISSKVNIL